MRIIQLIPGAGTRFYCENCLRDSALEKELRRTNHDIKKIPLYLPIFTDETNGRLDSPVFFGGINVYLQQKSALFRKTPGWVDRIFDAPVLLNWAAGMTGMTRAVDLAETTLSMLRGEDGHQAKELKRLTDWLALDNHPDVVQLSNALLLGMAPSLKQRLNVPIVCTLQDEDIFIDPLPEPYRSMIHDKMTECAAHVDAFIAVSHYYKNAMCERLDIPHDKVHVVYNGINLNDYKSPTMAPVVPVIGFLERQCPEKGVELIVEAFITLKKRNRVPAVKLRIAGGTTADDDKHLHKLRHRLAEAELDHDVEFLPNLDKKNKLAFLKSLSVMSVPAVHKEAFGIYVLEALAAGVPVVQPDHGAFPELIELTGGGVLVEPNNPATLALALENLLLDRERARQLGQQGRKSVLAHFGTDRMAKEFVQVMEKVTAK